MTKNEKKQQKTPLKPPLTAELKVFENIRPQLQEENPEGGFVVIKGDKTLGVWRARSDALREGTEEFGDVPFLVRDIHESDEPINFTRDVFAVC